MKNKNNVFSMLIQMLSTVSVRGEADMHTMTNVFNILHGMENAVDAPDIGGGQDG